MDQSSSKQVPEASLRSLLMSSPDGIVITDTNGVVRFVNPAAEALFGDTADDMVGDLFSFPVTVDEENEIKIIRSDGVVRAVKMRALEMVYANENVYLAWLRDYTEYDQAKEKAETLLFGLLEKTEKLLLPSIEKINSLLSKEQGDLNQSQEEILTRLSLDLRQYAQSIAGEESKQSLL